MIAHPDLLHDPRRTPPRQPATARRPADARPAAEAASATPAAPDLVSAEPASVEPNSGTPVSSKPASARPVSPDPATVTPASPDSVSAEPESANGASTKPELASAKPASATPASTDSKSAKPASPDSASVDPEPAPSPDPSRDADELFELGERIAELAARINSAEARMMTLIADFDRRGGWRDGFGSCAEWLAWRTGVKIGSARERVRTARALERLPQTAEALRRGSVSYAKVRALTRVATPEREAELLEFARAGSAAKLERTVRTWRRLSREGELTAERARHRARAFSVFVDGEGMYVVRGRLEPEAGAVLMRAVEAASDALFRREPHHGPDAPPATEADARRRSGRRRADAVGLLAERALAAGFGEGDGSRSDRDAVAPPGHQPNATPRSHPGHLDEHGVDEVRSGGDAHGPPGRDADNPRHHEVDDIRSRDARHPTGHDPRAPSDHDLHGLPGGDTDARPDRGTDDDPPTRSSGGPKPTNPPQSRHLSRAQPRSGTEPPTQPLDRPKSTHQPPAPAPPDIRSGTRAERYQVVVHCDAATLAADGEPGRSDLDGVRVSAETSRRMACDAAVVAMVHARDGSVLSVGRRTRTIPPHIRRALDERDRGCRFPGCACRFTEAHHVRHWADGGATSLRNTLLLCRRHHRAVHEGRVKVSVNADGTVLFVTPGGRILVDAPARPAERGSGNGTDGLAAAGSRTQQTGMRPAADGSRGPAEEGPEATEAADALREPTTEDPRTAQPEVSGATARDERAVLSNGAALYRDSEIPWRIEAAAREAMEESLQ